VPFDIRQIIELAPLVIGAMKPGSPESAALMRGFMRAQQQRRQQGLEDQQLQEQRAFRESQIANTAADNRRADEALRLQREHADLGRLEQFRGAAKERANELIGGADLGMSPTDPGLQNQIALDQFQLANQYGVPGAQSTTLPNVLAPMSTRKRNKAKEIYEQAKKTYGDEAMANDAITIKTGELFGDVKPSQLRTMYELPAVAPGGQAATPYVSDPEAKTVGSFDAQFADVLAAEEEKLGRKLTRTEKASLRLKSKTTYDAANDRPRTEPRPRYNVQQVTNPDGTTGLIRVNMETGETTRVSMPKGVAGAGRPNSTEQTSSAYLIRTEASDKTAKSFESKLAGLGGQFDVQLPNLLASKEGQLYRQAQDEFINAALRRESGAAIQPSEYDRFAKIYFVRPGDTPETIAQKQAARERVVKGFQTATGNLGKRPAQGAVEYDWINGQLVPRKP